MNYMKYTQYAYLIAAVFLFYDGFTKLNTDTNQGYLMLILGAGALALFFFRRKFAKKFEDRSNNQ